MTQSEPQFRSANANVNIDGNSHNHSHSNSHSNSGNAIRQVADMTSACPLAWGTTALWQQLVGQLPNLSVEVVARMPSTNSALLERARVARHDASGCSASETSAHGELQSDDSGVVVRRSTESRAFGRRAVDWQPCLLVAEHQTAGRGRHGHHWHAAAGSSLTFSIALRLNPPDWAGLSLAVGVALAEALDPVDATNAETGAPRLCVKWPNDLWLVDSTEQANANANANSNASAAGSAASGVEASSEGVSSRGVSGRKLGGVLIETVASGDKRLVVVGVGLNVLPMNLVLAQASSGTACLQELLPHIDAPTALARIALPLVNALQTFEREGFAAFAERFAQRDFLYQRRVATTQAGLEDGIAQGVSRTGALQVRTPSGLHCVTSGEVSVRPVPAAAVEGAGVDADAVAVASSSAFAAAPKTKSDSAC